MPKLDLTGQKIGMLKLLKREKRRNCTWYYCRCDCGNYKWIRQMVIRRSKLANCGCVRKNKVKKLNGKQLYTVHLEKNIKCNTNIALIDTNKLNKNNTSGIKGVYWDKARNKWHAQIKFKKKTYFLGRYDNKEDAIKTRKQAEEKLFGEFLEWYKENVKEGK